MSAQSRALGIDIGGTKIAVATVTGTGEIVREETIPTEPGRGFASGVRRITEAAERVLDESGWSARDLEGVGVGCAGPVDSAGGIIRNPYTLSAWSGGDIVTPLRDAFGCLVRLENDADMALLGECHAGAGRGFDAVVMLTFGTGIGGAALVGGSILRGAGGSHPDMGHVPAGATGPSCYCGTSGCFESLASGSALSAAAAARGLADSRQLLARAREGDRSAADAVRQALDATATATWTIVHMLMPQRLILGGGMMDEHYETFAAAARAAISRIAMPPPGGVSVERARLGNRAGIVGAASAVMNRKERD